VSSEGVVVLISAGAEWRVVRARYSDASIERTPHGETFRADVGVHRDVRFMHGGWGKIAAAASTQYALDRFAPRLLVNLGTCGGFEGEVRRGDIILCERTVVYDIIEQMSDPDAAIEHYATTLDLTWLSPSHPPADHRTLLVSADRDLLASELPTLRTRYGAVAGDWESGAIAWVAARSGIHTLILRGVSDVVGPTGGEAYDGGMQIFREGVAVVMTKLLDDLEGWIAAAPAPPATLEPPGPLPSC
jgi:adenosylhomocysteine nucleosidase